MERKINQGARNWVYVALFLSLFIWSGCKTVKTSRTAQKAVSETIQASAEEKTQIETKTEGKAKTVITERADSTLVLEGQELHGSSNNLQADPIILNGNGWVTVVTDSAGKVKAKTVLRSQTVTFKIDKRTEKDETVSQTKTEKKDSLGESKVKFKEEEKFKDKEVERSTGFPWYLWLILLVIALYLGWRFRAKILS